MKTSSVSMGLVALFIGLGVPATGMGTSIVGCVNGTTGALRIVTPSSSCRTNESAIELAPPPTTSPPSTFTMTVPQGNADAVLATLDNGVVVHGGCFAEFVQINLVPASNALTLQAFGTSSGGNSVEAVDVQAGGSLLIESTSTPVANFDVVARDGAVGGQFARISVRGLHADPCTFWGMIIPSD